MNSCSQSPVFIVASERSGTNLLRKRITESQGSYIGPSPAHFLKNLYFQEPYYGNLENDSCFEKFAEDAIALCTRHFSPWQIDWSPEELVQALDGKERNSISLMHYMMNRYANENGYDGYICKDNFLYEFAVDIAATLPESRFIYLYRDPRDYVLSQMKRPGALQSCARYARLWSYEQTRAIAVCSKLERSGRCLRVSYEDFISNEDDSLNRILDFIGGDRSAESRYQDYHRESVHEWSNLAGETLRNNSEKFRSEMSERDIWLVESICAKQMEYLGYETFSTNARSVRRLDLAFDYFQAYFKRIFTKNTNLKKASVQEREKLLKKLYINYRSDV
ncbi:MAG: sulfotransferase [Alcanivorax jadensis]|uniref:sulfotransferase family protein n=1 Tax=Alcanivorax jadensis TaxID=64988 RepID=UPI003001611E